MPLTRALAPVVCLALLGAGAGRAAAQPGSEAMVVLRVRSDCDRPGLTDATRLAPLLAVELVSDGVSRVITEEPPSGANVLATVEIVTACEGIEVRVHVDDRVTDKTVQRSLPGPGVGELAQRELALAVAELLRASWLEVLVVDGAAARAPPALRRALSARVMPTAAAPPSSAPPQRGRPARARVAPSLQVAVGARWAPTLRTVLGEAGVEIGPRGADLLWLAGVTVLSGSSIGAPVDAYVGAALARAGAAGRLVLGPATSTSLAVFLEGGLGWTHGVRVGMDREATGGTAFVADATLRWSVETFGVATAWSGYLQASAVLAGMEATSFDATAPVAGIRDVTFGAGARLGFSP